MIVPMSKVHIVTRDHDRDNLLDALGALGVVHVEPIDPALAVADEDTTEAISTLDSAIRILQGVTVAGDAPEREPMQAAREAVAIFKAIHEEKEQLSTLHRQADQLAMWGNVELATLGELKESGVEVKFYIVSDKDVPQCQADCLQVLTQLPGHQALIGVVDRSDRFELPEGGKALDWPARDLPSIKKEALELDASIKTNQERLGSLANLISDLQAEREAYLETAKFAITRKSGLSQATLFALQGWIPKSKSEDLNGALIQEGISAAVDVIEPEEGDAPPTLIEYPKWTMPVKGLFDILGTVAGYREFDVAVPFMLALPIFAAMLIGDGGYGGLLFLGLLLGYKKLAPTLGKEFTQLLIVVGAVSLLWGFLCASFFGFVLYKPIIAVNMTDQSRFLLMQISFFMGAIHLSIAQGWQALRLFPDLRFLGKIGWALFIWGMLGVVRMFVLNTSIGWDTLWPYLLCVGTVLAILFDTPSKNIFKMVLTGCANFPLSMLGAFSDIISYVRLMAVGLASGVLASSFNDLALDSGSLFIAVPTLVFGHTLNLGLAMIALFAHGVRLNMLEFSNNLGMQWIGNLYKPFSKEMIQE